MLIFLVGGLVGAAVAGNVARTRIRQAVAQALAADHGPASAAEGEAPPTPALPDQRPTSAEVPLATLSREPLRFLSVGGGADPLSTQVQLEQDVALFAETVREATGEDGAILFAGGPSVRAVQVLEYDERPPRAGETDEAAVLRAALGELVDPRPERAARYRTPALAAQGSADADAFLALLGRQLQLPGERLEVFVASHGDAGETPADNYVALWGDTSFDARQLAAALAPTSSRRGARLVLTACFGGGFAELAFDGADANAGPTASDVCGLFATSADHESNGCDANPDRQAQEGYALHLLRALRGHDRDGTAVAAIDLDGDGQVGVLEAHTWARIASRSIDLPSTTSERFLRSLPSVDAATSLELVGYATPEEDAVIRALGGALGIATEEAVSAARQVLEVQLEGVAGVVEERAQAEDDALRELLLTVGTRWPELLDPFRPDFDAVLRANIRELGAVLRSEVARAHAQARRQTERALLDEDGLRLRWVQLLRLERAFETRRLARVLASTRSSDDPARQRYEAFLACERAPLRSATTSP